MDRRPSFADVCRDFSPAWFASVMGTAVIPLALSFLSFGALRAVAGGFMVLSVLMFVAALVPWTVRLVRFRHEVLRDLDHPVAAHFFPTMPIALVILALDLLKFPDLFFGVEASSGWASSSSCSSAPRSITGMCSSRCR